MSNIHEDYYNLQQKYKECQRAIRDALGCIYCVGGPLNDNVLRYTNEQLRTFHQIACKLEYVEEGVTND